MRMGARGTACIVRCNPTLLLDMVGDDETTVPSHRSPSTSRTPVWLGSAICGGGVPVQRCPEQGGGVHTRYASGAVPMTIAGRITVDMETAPTSPPPCGAGDAHPEFSRHGVGGVGTHHDAARLVDLNTAVPVLDGGFETDDDAHTDASDDSIPPPGTPPTADTHASRPEVFEDILFGSDTDLAPAGDAHPAGAPTSTTFPTWMTQWTQSTAFAPGTLVRVNATREVGFVKDVSAGAFLRLATGTVCMKPDTTLLCGPLFGGIPDPAAFDGDLEFARQVVFELTHRGYMAIESFVDPDTRRRAAEEAAALTTDDAHMFKAGTGRAGIDHRQRTEHLRGDTIRWLPKDGSLPPAMQAVEDRLTRLRRALTHVTGRPLQRSSTQLARYDGGGVGYVRHRDAPLNAVPRDKRRVTCVYYLNEDWQPEHGGCLELYPNSQLSQTAELRGDTPEALQAKHDAKYSSSVRVQPRSGTLIIFRSCIIHTVLPDHHPRTALTNWFLGSEALGVSHPESLEDIDECFTGRSDVFPSR